MHTDSIVCLKTRTSVTSGGNKSKNHSRRHRRHHKQFQTYMFINNESSANIIQSFAVKTTKVAQRIVRVRTSIRIFFVYMITKFGVFVYLCMFFDFYFHSVDVFDFLLHAFECVPLYSYAQNEAKLTIAICSEVS